MMNLCTYETLFCRIIQEMESNKKLGDIVLGNKDCNIVGRLARLWDSRNMRSRTTDSLISVDGLIVDKDVSVFLSSKMLLSNILSQQD
jgi:hypothetical protein